MPLHGSPLATAFSSQSCHNCVVRGRTLCSAGARVLILDMRGSVKGLYDTLMVPNLKPKVWNRRPSSAAGDPCLVLCASCLAVLFVHKVLHSSCLVVTPCCVALSRHVWLSQGACGRCFQLPGYFPFRQNVKFNPGTRRLPMEGGFEKNTSIFTARPNPYTYASPRHQPSTPFPLSLLPPP